MFLKFRISIDLRNDWTLLPAGNSKEALQIVGWHECEQWIRATKIAPFINLKFVEFFKWLVEILNQF